MVKCSVCTQIRELEVGKNGSSDYEIQDLVELPLKTERKGLIVLCCPRCDGNVVKHPKERNAK